MIKWNEVFMLKSFFFFFNDTATTEIYTLSLHDALPISAQNRASKSESRTVCSSPRRTLCTLAAISSASVRGDSTPASASRSAASATSSSSRLIIASTSQLGFQIGGRQRVDHAVQLAVDDLVQVVGLVVHP